MKFEEVFCNTFKAIRKAIAHDEFRKSVDYSMPSMPMVDACRADNFDFFQPFITSGHLTVEQMQRACQRYFLGKTKSGQPIFWMIDDMLAPLDAHIGDTWLSTLLKVREPLIVSWQVCHCLFGLHLLCHTAYDYDKPICVVESERSAVILSEILPESIWMAYTTTTHFTPDLFAPLQGRTVTIYPRTDPVGEYYLASLELARQVRRLYDIDITVDSTLDYHATPEEKSRCIDLLDFLFSKDA